MSVTKVQKRSGKTEEFSDKKVLNCAKRACKGLDYTDPKQVVYNATLKLYDGIKSKEIDEALIKSARALIEQEPQYNYVAARLLLGNVYKEVFGEGVDSDAFELQYRKSFITNLKKLTKAGIVNKELLKYDLKALSNALQLDNDYLFPYRGLQTVNDRYFYRIDGAIVESPQSWLMRVAMGLALAEKPEDRTKSSIEFYKVLSSFRYMTSTPTLFNAGGVRNQLSSCFLNTFEDSLEGIFDGLHQEAQKSKFAGGLGMDFTPFRAGNAVIASTGGRTQGSVYIWKMFNDMLVAINQSGKRRGAGCGYLETWHYDVEDFLELKKNTGDERRRCHDLNTANWIPDLFMNQVRNDAPWYLMSPDEAPELHELFGAAFEQKYWEYVDKGKRGEMRLFKEVSAKELWKKMLKMLFETGHPWMTWKDACNIRYTNQHEGVVHSSNLCTEITLHNKPTLFENNNDRQIKTYGETAVCNLGSVNVGRHTKIVDGIVEIDWPLLADTIRVATRMLDNVIDINFYPTQEAKISNVKHRPVGLGSMGWHDLFYALDINYDSDAAVDMSDKLYEFMSMHAIWSSSKLAQERGAYSTYQGSLWSQNIFPVDSYNNLAKARSNGDASMPLGKETLPQWAEVREHVGNHGMRNSNVMAIAPTATISNIVGCSSCTEPYFSNIYVGSSLSGDFTIINEAFVNDLKKLGLWNYEMLNEVKRVNGDVAQLSNVPFAEKLALQEKYKTAFQVDQFKLLTAAAMRGKWIDQAMSVNLFNDKTSLKHLHDLYMHAWALGMKTTYYLRNKGASDVEKASVSAKAAETNISSIEDLGETQGLKACLVSDPTCESCQ
jgi:ribonucleoside-diphosphate reductase alpha chain